MSRTENVELWICNGRQKVKNTFFIQESGVKGIIEKWEC